MHTYESGSAAPAVAEPAHGALTFLCTGVEGRVPLWERHEARMPGVAARLVAIITAHHGHRAQAPGVDGSIFAIFASPADAVAAALEIGQAALSGPRPAEASLAVCLGLHSGLAQYRDGHYYGPAVNRCVRIRALGHDGQILLSSATAALARDTLPEGASLRSLGRHSVQGLAEPEELFQLCHPDLPGECPPLPAPPAPRHNLPRQLTSLVGREQSLGEVLALLGAERLVTLTGAGGVGKTRLALAVAAELADQEPDGAWLVDLAPLADPGLVPNAVTQALGLHEEPGRAILATLTDYLKDRRLVLVLDNCEHLREACAGLVRAVLRSCPGVRVLATSRAPLRLQVERRRPVPPLELPAAGADAAVEGIASAPAAALFVARARAVEPSFTLDAENAAAVAHICRRLDGLPLALELAAARIKTRPPAALLEELGERLRALGGGGRNREARQRTIHGTLDWSYTLLSPGEQALFARLSVFAGGWTLEAAAAVCVLDDDLPFPVAEGLAGLAENSLVQVEEATGRYGMLHTIQEYAGYALERLQALEDGGRVHGRHAAHYLALAEEAAPRLTGPEQATWLARLEVEHDNLRAALGWVRERGEGDLGLRLAAALWRFWETRGYFSEGRGWLEAALAEEPPARTVARATALNGAGILAFEQGEYARAAPLLEEALALSRELGDRRAVINALNSLGNMAFLQGEYGRAAALFEEVLALSRELGDRRTIAYALGNLGIVAHLQGEYGRAAALLEEVLALSRELGDRRASAIALGNLGEVAHLQGEYARAAALLEEGLALSRELGDTRTMAVALGNLGKVAHGQGEYARATARYRESLGLWREQGNREGIAGALEGLARLAGAIGQAGRGARLFGAAEALRQTIGAPLPPRERRDHEQALATLRAALGEETFAGAWAEGRGLSLDEALTLALEDTGAVQSIADRMS